MPGFKINEFALHSAHYGEENLNTQKRILSGGKHLGRGSNKANGMGYYTRLFLYALMVKPMPTKISK